MSDYIEEITVACDSLSIEPAGRNLVHVTLKSASISDIVAAMSAADRSQVLDLIGVDECVSHFNLELDD